MYESNEFPIPAKLIASGVALFIILLLVLFNLPFGVIGTGERGVVFSNSSGIQDKILGEGWYFRTPFIESVKTLSVQTQKTEVKSAAASKDLQTVSVVIAVNWKLDSNKVNKIYQNIGDEQDVVDRILNPNVQEVVKASTAKYTAEQLLTLRANLKNDIDLALGDRLKSYNIILDDVSIVDLDFSPEFNKAIEAKAAAVQNAQKAENDLVRIKTEAEQRVSQARGEAEAIRIQTEALNQNQNLIELEKAKRWDGKLPTTIVGGGTVPFFNIN